MIARVVPASWRRGSHQYKDPQPRVWRGLLGAGILLALSMVSEGGREAALLLREHCATVRVPGLGAERAGAGARAAACCRAEHLLL